MPPPPPPPPPPSPSLPLPLPTTTARARSTKASSEVGSGPGLLNTAATTAAPNPSWVSVAFAAVSAAARMADDSGDDDGVDADFLLFALLLLLLLPTRRLLLSPLPFRAPAIRVSNAEDISKYNARNIFNILLCFPTHLWCWRWCWVPCGAAANAMKWTRL